MRAGLLTLAIALFCSAPSANAFSTKIHITFANLIIENLENNGGRRIQLISPDYSKKAYFVELSKEDADAITGSESRYYFRGGAIGPDNTLFSGLTDPSHSPAFAPFSQCDWLYKKAQNQNEKAYALGCFLHGISDNVAHHIVNYMTQQTFTLNPNHKFRETGLEGLVLEPNKGLGVNLLNVFNHISTESRVEKSFRLDPDFGPDVFSKEALSHKIPKEFYEAVYLEPYGPYEGIDFDGEVSDPRKNQEDYFFSNIIDGLQKRKIGVLAKANLETSVGRTVPMSVGVYLTSPTPELRDKVRHEEMGAYKVSPLIKEYVKFLKGNGVDIPALAPWEMIMVLPVIIRDAQKLLDLHQLYREATYNWCASQSGFFGYAKRLWNSGFGCRETYALFDDNRYRFDKIFAHKRAQLDDVLKAHIASLENLSNWLNTHGDINSLTQDEVLNIVKPTMNALDKFSDITLLDVESAAPELGRIPGLLYVVQQELSEVTNLIKAQVRARLLEAYQMYAKQLAALKAQVARIQEKIDALIDKTLIGVLIRYKKQLEAEIKNIGKELLRERWDQNVENLLGLSDDESEWRELGADMLTNFPKSVGFMNAFNSVAAVLANHEVVNPPSKKEVVPSASSPLPISFQGPVSFDASFQLEYNQAALCPELKAIVYPCGISGAEMLQPAGYSSCVPFYDRIKEKMGSRNQAFLKLLDPEAECYDIENFVEGSQDNVFSFTKNPSIRNCAFKSIEEVQRKGRGSSSLAFPPQYAPANDKPYCQLGLDSLKIIEVNR